MVAPKGILDFFRATRNRVMMTISKSGAGGKKGSSPHFARDELLVREVTPDPSQALLSSADLPFLWITTEVKRERKRMILR